MKEQNNDSQIIILLTAILLGFAAYRFYLELDGIQVTLMLLALASMALVSAFFYREYFSKPGRDRRKRIETINDLPKNLILASSDGVHMGREQDLQISIYLPDSIRSRHIHILGGTGSGKTESVILNFLRQDVSRGLGSIILDAKGDMSFLRALREWVPKERLKVFDLSSVDSLGYDPLASGTSLEAAQRIYSSLTWSEEYYASKALSALQSIFQFHSIAYKRNPTLVEISQYLDSPKSYAATVYPNGVSGRIAEKEFSEITGLRDQIKILCSGHLKQLLSPDGSSSIQLCEASSGSVLYFRLQSLLSSQLASIVGKLLINHLSYQAGSAHRVENKEKSKTITPVYFDEFATFACPEFAGLISMARSANYALHFSHQSVGDLAEVSEGFLNQITDNSATKIIMRISDPDSAEFFARSFGTKIYQKVTQRVTNTKELDQAEVIGEGSQREARQFRASPDLFKTLPTGMGSVLIAHGMDTAHGGSTVFKIKFPKL